MATNSSSSANSMKSSPRCRLLVMPSLRPDTVTMRDGATLDDAAQLFWDRVKRYWPNRSNPVTRRMLQNQLRALRGLKKLQTHSTP